MCCLELQAIVIILFPISVFLRDYTKLGVISYHGQCNSKQGSGFKDYFDKALQLFYFFVLF